MELKNALTICLISFFSATLVLLIARALDLHTASRLEPQLAQIVQELQALRQQGGLPVGTGAPAANLVMADGLIVYYFHSNVRCVTCRAIQAQAHETVQSEYASQLAAGELAWKILNYEDASAADLQKQFEIQVPVIVLARMKDGQIDDWKRLDKVWALVGDKSAFAEFIDSEIDQMLHRGDPESTVEAEIDELEIPLPESDPVDLPVPADIPIPD